MRWTAIEPYLPSSTLLQLASVALTEDDEAVDSLAWTPSPHKNFTVKSAHLLQVEWLSLPDWKVWKVLWHLKVLERVRVFLWEASHAGLLTNEAR